MTIFLKQSLKFFDTVQEKQNRFSVKDRNSGFLCSTEIPRHPDNFSWYHRFSVFSYWPFHHAVGLQRALLKDGWEETAIHKVVNEFGCKGGFFTEPVDEFVKSSKTCAKYWAYSDTQCDSKFGSHWGSSEPKSQSRGGGSGCAGCATAHPLSTIKAIFISFQRKKVLFKLGKNWRI